MGSNAADDWETDPDFVRDMDETHQRWGSKRTVGSIDMNQLIDQVNREHKSLREKNQHPSQRGMSTGFEKQQTISRKLITETSEKSYVKEAEEGGPQLRRVEQFSSRNTNNRSSDSTRPPQPTIAPKPTLGDLKSRLSNSKETFSGGSSSMSYNNVKTEPPRQFEESTKTTKRIFQQKQEQAPLRSPPSSASGSSPSQAFKSIQDKIDAFKREFENIEHKVAKQSDLSQVIKKSTNIEKSSKDSVQYVTRSNDRLDRDNNSRLSSASNRPTSTSPRHTTTSSSSRTTAKGDLPPSKASIKSLSERFESLGRETSDDFRRRMEERRKEFFDEIKTQVRKTRKGLDGFDIIDSDDEDAERFVKTKSGGLSSSSSLSSPIKPKVYTKRETTQEQIVSHFVKENDKVLVDETKRNVERTSSRHGSSDEEEVGQPSNIKFIERELKSASPREERTQSPIDEIKRRIPVVEPTDQGSGLMARTLYDHQAAESDELSFDVDELITNIEKLDEGWYKGTITRNGHKLVGLFPANYVKLLNDSSFY